MQKSAGKIYLKKALLSALAGNVLTLLLLAVCALGVWRGDLPESAQGALALGAALLGAIAAGLTSSLGEGRGGAVLGVCGGGAYLLSVTIIGLYRVQGDFFSLDYIRLAICAVAGGAFGGVISTGKSTKKRKKRSGNYTHGNH